MINEQGTLAFLAYTHLQLAQSEIRDEELCESSKKSIVVWEGKFELKDQSNKYDLLW